MRTAIKMDDAIANKEEMLQNYNLKSIIKIVIISRLMKTCDKQRINNETKNKTLLLEPFKI